MQQLDKSKEVTQTSKKQWDYPKDDWLSVGMSTQLQ